MRSDLEHAKIFKVYAIFPAWENPRMLGLTWGVHYDAATLSRHGMGNVW